jgi:hypothetical protein
MYLNFTIMAFLSLCMYLKASENGGGGGSKPFRTVDFASKFIMIIERTNFKLRFY